MKVKLKIEEILVYLRNPKLILKYCTRYKNLEKFLNVDKRDVKKYVAEANGLTKIMLKKIVDAHAFGSSAMISKFRGVILYVCLRALKPSIMIETGVAFGSSAYYILQAMQLNGKGQLYSIDLPNADPLALIPKGREVGWLAPSELKHRWKLILGSTQEKLPSLLHQLGEIDAFLHDSEHTYETMMFEYETVWPYLREGGLLLSDDVHWTNAFTDFLKSKRPKNRVIFDGLGAVLK